MNSVKATIQLSKQITLDKNNFSRELLRIKQVGQIIDNSLIQALQTIGLEHITIDTRTNTQSEFKGILPHNNYVSRICFSPNDQQLVISCGKTPLSGICKQENKLSNSTSEPSRLFSPLHRDRSRDRQYLGHSELQTYSAIQTAHGKRH